MNKIIIFALITALVSLPKDTAKAQEPVPAEPPSSVVQLATLDNSKDQLIRTAVIPTVRVITPQYEYVEPPAPAVVVPPKPVVAVQPAVRQYAKAEVEAIVRQAARTHGINEDYFVRIAICESTLNNLAVNGRYAEIGGMHPSGVFQHLANYWPKRAATYGYAGASVFDPVANANVTAQMFKAGSQSLWECK